MDKITRQSVLHLLNGDWADYVNHFRSLPLAAQAAFLEKQGYKRLTDLLAHIVAWWEEGLQAIQRFQNDPEARQPEIDIDSFNALAVEKVRAVGEVEEIRIFEEARGKFVEVVENLSKDDFKDERVLTQLKWELINHLEDHRIQ
jgi:hypothetical protein